jgi:hypothetical protein
MPPDTPPPTTYDRKAAYDCAAWMVPRADGYLNARPVWHGWALVEAYMAGYAAGRQPEPETEYAGE